MAASSGLRGDIRDSKTRRVISQMDKLELEDKHYRLMEENLALKKYSRSQEEKIKKMATKLIRLTSDEKREAKRDGGLVQNGLCVDDLESDLDDALSKNRELEKQNMSLKSKVVVLRQQLESHGKRHTPYDRIQSRVSTGIKKRSLRSVSTEDISVKKPVAQDATTQSSVSCHNILEEVRRDNQELEDQLLQLRQEVSALKAEKERNREQQRLKAVQFEEEKLQLQDELQAKINALQKENTESEMALLKSRRELRDRNTRLEVLQTKYTSLERNNDLLKTSHSRVVQEIDVINQQLKEERNRTTQLQSQLHDSRLSQRTISELQEMVEDLRGERDRLRETNDRLTRRQGEVVTGKEQQLKSQLKATQQRLRELEGEHKKEMSKKSKLINELAVERELSEKLDEELKDVRSMYLQLKQDYDQIKDKLSFFNKESSIDWSEVEEALVMVRQKKSSGEEVIPLLSQPEVKGQAEIHELRTSLADTINELEKTRQLLQMQHTINKEYKSEVESVKCHMLEKDQEHASQLQEYAQLLDIKAARIRKLESQLKDIAYGTRQVKLDTRRFEYEGEEADDSVSLERGQNLLQFHLAQVTLSNEAISHLHTTSPALFVSFNFSDYEVQVTPVKQGSRPQFGYTSSFVVTVDEAFLHHLQRGSISIEVNQGLGFKYQTLAVACVKCKELIASSGGKVHGKVSLTGVDSFKECVSVGTLEYWMRLKLPVTQAIRLYQEQSKALSALDKERSSSITQHTPSHQTTQDPSYNELCVTINKCHGLESHLKDTMPSCYVMYKFYTFLDHDTPIVPHSLTPVFNNKHSFPLSMNQHLDDYLKTESLEVYLFDDSSENEAYISMACVPLLELANGQPIAGNYQLLNVQEEPCGYLDISLHWKHPYHTPTPPLTATQSPPHIRTPIAVATHTVTSKPTTKSAQSIKHSTAHKAQPLSTAKKEIKSSSQTENVTEYTHKTTESNVESRPATVEPAEPKLIDKKVAILPDDSPASDESSALSELDSQSVKSEDLSITTGSKRVAKISRHKAPPKVQRTKRTKNLTKASTEAVPALKNSLPPLKQELPPIKPVPKNTIDIPSLQHVKNSPVQSQSESSETGSPTHSVAEPVKTDLPLELGTHASDSDDDFSVTETESMMSGLAGLESTEPDTLQPHIVHSPEISAASSQISLTPTDETISLGVTDKQAEAVKTSAGGKGRMDGSNQSEDEIEEQLSEGKSEEDTMFEDPLHQSDTEDVFSDLSEHSSDKIPTLKNTTPLMTKPTPPAPHHNEASDDDWSEITPSEQQDGDPITSNTLTVVSESIDSIASLPHTTMSITIESFTLAANSPLAKESGGSNLFVEYQFLDFDFGDLETPTSLPKPAPGESIVFNFEKVFQLNSSQVKMLENMLKPGDPSGGRIVFTVVADPEDQEADCDELGTAELDLKMILQNGQDLDSESIDVLSCDGPEKVGSLTVTVQALEALQALN